MPSFVEKEEKMTLTKAELADLLFEKVGFNKREAKDMVESFFEFGAGLVCVFRTLRRHPNPCTTFFTATGILL